MIVSNIDNKIIYKLDDLMKERHLNIHRLCIITDLRYETIKLYLSGDLIRIDVYILAKLCFALNCHIEDIIEIKLD